MKQAISTGDPLKISIPAARLSLATSLAALVSLAGLHILSPEFDPSQRFVSEYAFGHYGWVLSVMFFTWGLSSWALVFAIRSQARTLGGKIGLVFLVAAGVGEAMASVFDVRRPALHGLAGAIGIPSLPIAAVLISVSLGRTRVWSSRKSVLLWTANLTWASLGLMVAIMLSPTGKMGGLRVPIGWSNRLLITTYSVWVMSVAWQAIRLRGKDIVTAKSAGVDLT